MQGYKKKNNNSDSLKLVFKSAIWTLIAISLIVIGYLGAGYLSEMI